MLFFEIDAGFPHSSPYRRRMVDWALIIPAVFSSRVEVYGGGTGSMLSFFMGKNEGVLGFIGWGEEHTTHIRIYLRIIRWGMQEVADHQHHGVLDSSQPGPGHIYV